VATIEEGKRKSGRWSLIVGKKGETRNFTSFRFTLGLLGGPVPQGPFGKKRRAHVRHAYRCWEKSG